MFACAALRSRPRALLVSLAMCVLGGCASGGPGPGSSATVPELARLPADTALIGLRGGDLEGVMGRPALVRREGAAQYWRYGLAGCQLDLFLYADPESGSARVAYLDARPALGAPPANAQACAHLARRLRAGAGPSRPEPLPGPPVSAPL
jgi:hypothetical protein